MDLYPIALIAATENSDDMSTIVFKDYQGESIKVDGKCYSYIGEVEEDVTNEPEDVENNYLDCLDCLDSLASPSPSPSP